MLTMELPLSKLSLSLAVVVHTSNYSTQEAEAGELQDSQGYTEKLHSEKQTKTN